MTISWKKLLWGACLLLPLSAMAEQHASSAIISTTTDSTIIEPSVEDNIRDMDKDHDGMVTVFEVRSFIEARHGKGYKKQTLDNMEASAGGTSCSTPFSKPLY